MKIAYGVQVTFDGETQVLLNTLRPDEHGARVQLRNLRYNARHGRHWFSRVTDARVVRVAVTVVEEEAV